MKVTSKAAAEFGRRGGSSTSEAKAEASRLNGKLGGRRKQVDEPMRDAVARLQRARLLLSSIEVVLSSDVFHLRSREVQALDRAAKTLRELIPRFEKIEVPVAESSETPL